MGIPHGEREAGRDHARSAVRTFSPKYTHGPDLLLQVLQELEHQEISAHHQPSPRQQELTADHIRNVCPLRLHHQPLFLTAAGKNETR